MRALIYTVTFNPALDYAVYLDRFTLGATNRTAREELRCGGKGVNVSIVLRNLGMETRALGFLAGFTGRTIAAWLTQMGVEHDFIFLPVGMSRINVKLKTEEETEINGQGPHIPPEALEAMCAKLNRLTGGDTLILAGSVPPSMPGGAYERILSRLDGTGTRVVVDAAGPLLLSVLPHRPFLIKPNHEELGALCGTRLDPEDTGAILDCARSLQARGARNVLVSMGGAGAVLVTEDGQALRQAAAKGTLVNSVGAGDSMVAGFLAGLARSGSFREALRMGAAAGSATAFSPWLAARHEVEALFHTL